ncbi:MAG TPA: hypothetical protein VGB97_02490 [Candidatus Paceibacterota bacterium]|jgi:hypothetical protein
MVRKLLAALTCLVAIAAWLTLTYAALCMVVTPAEMSGLLRAGTLAALSMNYIGFFMHIGIEMPEAGLILCVSSLCAISAAIAIFLPPPPPQHEQQLGFDF